MLLDVLYEAFPDRPACLRFLEHIIWKDEAACPYCGSRRRTKGANNRYHCNNCNRNYRVTIQTVFQNTQCDLQKWFAAIVLLGESKNEVSIRWLARRIEVPKDTATAIKQKIADAFVKQPRLYKLIRNDINQAIDKLNTKTV